MTRTQKYTVKEFNLSGLQGISDKTLEMHFKLYKGNVNVTNTLNEHIAHILHDGEWISRKASLFRTYPAAGIWI